MIIGVGRRDLTIGIEQTIPSADTQWDVDHQLFGNVDDKPAELIDALGGSVFVGVRASARLEGIVEIAPHPGAQVLPPGKDLVGC